MPSFDMASFAIASFFVASFFMASLAIASFDMASFDMASFAIGSFFIASWAQALPPARARPIETSAAVILIMVSSSSRVGDRCGSDAAVPAQPNRIQLPPNQLYPWSSQ